MTPETLSNQLKVLKNEERSILIESLKSAIKSTLVEKFNEGDERPCENSDFSEWKKYNEIQISHLKFILEDLIKISYFSQGIITSEESGTSKTSHTYPDMENTLLELILILCGENSDVKPWNTETTVKNCSAILSLILKPFDFVDASQLMSKCKKGNIVKNILEVLRPNLLATTWKHYPASVVCFNWILETIRQPVLSSHLPVVLPTALLLVDDFVIENRLIGVRCLHHIIDNVTVAELQFHGYGDVIYGALMPLLRIRDSNITNNAVSCLLPLTVKLEMDFREKNVTQWSRFDSILEIYLENMELEQLLELRNCYIANLGPLLSASSITTIRWSKRLLRIFREYMQAACRHQDEKTINSCLLVIEKYMEASKPIANFYAKNLLFTLLAALSNVNNQSNCNIQIQNKEVAIKCIKMVLRSISEYDKKELKVQLEEKFRNDSDLIILYQQLCDLIEDK